MTYKNQTWSESPFPDLDSNQTFILVFYSPKYYQDHSPFIELKKHYPLSTIVGCSTSGEIYNQSINDDSLSIAIVKFSHSNIKSFTQSINDYAESYHAGIKIGESLKADNLKAILLLSDGIIVNGTELVEGAKSILGPEVIITGGLAGDGTNFTKTSILKDSISVNNHICAVGFYGDDIKISFGSSGGWETFGPEKLITLSQKNVLYEIDKKPALDLYKEYLGEKSKELPSSALLFPLGISEKRLDKKVVRTVLSVNESEKSMTFAGNIPQGWYMQFMKARFDNLVQAALLAGQAANINMPRSSDKLAIAISCVGRRLVLKEKSESEVKAVLDSLGKKTRLIGFYSYGEISPTGKVSNCDLHNQTMTITTISENIRGE